MMTTKEFSDFLHFLRIACKEKDTRFINNFTYNDNDITYKLVCIMQENISVSTAACRKELYRIVTYDGNVTVNEPFFVLASAAIKSDGRLEYKNPIPLVTEPVYIPEVIDLDSFEVIQAHYKARLVLFTPEKEMEQVREISA